MESDMNWKTEYLTLYSQLPKSKKPQARVRPFCTSVSVSKKQTDIDSSLRMFFERTNDIIYVKVL
jgi:hypothetical protein